LVEVLVFFCELVNSSLGMGYGTTPASVLLLLGFLAGLLVPSVLPSEPLSDLCADAFHHGRRSISLRKGSSG